MLISRDRGGIPAVAIHTKLVPLYSGVRAAGSVRVLHDPTVDGLHGSHLCVGHHSFHRLSVSGWGKFCGLNDSTSVIVFIGSVGRVLSRLVACVTVFLSPFFECVFAFLLFTLVCILLNTYPDFYALLDLLGGF